MMPASASEPVWRQADGQPVACREKLLVLDENAAELASVLRDAFDDALLIGVDEDDMRRRLHAMVDALASPLIRR